MSLISVYVDQTVDIDYKYDEDWRNPPIITTELKKNKVIQPEDTGMLIFGPDQGKELETFLTDDRYKILFKSNKCYNNRYSGPQRNTLVIFELKETDGESSSV